MTEEKLCYSVWYRDDQTPAVEWDRAGRLQDRKLRQCFSIEEAKDLILLLSLQVPLYGVKIMSVETMNCKACAPGAVSPEPLSMKEYWQRRDPSFGGD